MILPVKFSTRQEILQLIRSASNLADLADDEDTKLLLSAGIVPKDFLKSVLKSNRISYPEFPVKHLVDINKLIETDLYLKANPRSRTRPIASQYSIVKPTLRLSTRNPMTYNMFGRDRLLLWYAAANQERTGSRGEAYGLWTVLQFIRQPAIQRAFRRWKTKKGHPSFKLPEDAR